MIELDAFLKLPDKEIANLVRANGSRVCAFPINGTRRWFTFEYGDKEWDDPITAYMDTATTKHIELYKLFFDHGIETLITPVIGPEILETRDAYMQKIGAEGLKRIIEHPEYVSFYNEYQVHASFYGDFRQHLTNTVYENLIDVLDSLTEKTRGSNRNRLLFGAFADNLNATNVVAKNAIQYFKEHGEVPDRKTLVTMYYGEYIEKVDFFIGFDRLAVFDYPLLNTGEEDLYFTTAPSPYLGKEQLRRILYDHLYTRRIQERSYETLTPEEFIEMKNYYHSKIDSIIGIGKIKHGFWIPEEKNSREDI